MIQNIDALYVTSSSKYDHIQLTPDYLTLVKNYNPTKTYIIIKVSVIQSIKKNFIYFEPDLNAPKKNLKKLKKVDHLRTQSSPIIDSSLISNKPHIINKSPSTPRPNGPKKIDSYDLETPETPSSNSSDIITPRTFSMNGTNINDTLKVLNSTSIITPNFMNPSNTSIMICVEGGQFQGINLSREKMYIGQIDENTLNNFILRINQIRCQIRLQSIHKTSDPITQLSDLIDKSRKSNVTQNETILKKLQKILSISNQSFNNSISPTDFSLAEENRFKQSIKIIRQELMGSVNIYEDIVSTNHWDMYSPNNLPQSVMDREIAQMSENILSLSSELDYIYPSIGQIIACKKNVKLLENFESMFGILVLTTYAYFFIPIAQGSNHNKLIKKIYLNQIRTVLNQRYVTKEIALEIFLHSPLDNASSKSHFFVFDNEEDRNSFSNASPIKEKIENISESISKMQKYWINGEISNYDYILFLNQRSGRTFHDISQYPIFPWILQDYSSDSLDLSDPLIYRDLSKPIGATNSDRLKSFIQRSQENNFPYLYTTHYSTPGYISFFLTRTHPELILSLQNGTYDVPDRLFKDIYGAFQSSYTNPSDIKELIPEFYAGDGAFLKNIFKLSLGTTNETQIVVDDVKLPPWAPSIEEFIRIHRTALESQYVSQNLHKWIDLIFGYNQLPPRSHEVYNSFPTYMYDGPENLINELGYDEQTAELQVYEFGHMSRVLFLNDPHPSRFTPLDNSYSKIKALEFDKSKIEMELQKRKSEIENYIIQHDKLLKEKNTEILNLKDLIEEKSQQIETLEFRLKEFETSSLISNPNQTILIEQARNNCPTCSNCASCSEIKKKLEPLLTEQHDLNDELSPISSPPSLLRNSSFNLLPTPLKSPNLSISQNLDQSKSPSTLVRKRKKVTPKYILPPQVVNEVNGGIDQVSRETYILNLELRLNQLMQDHSRTQQLLESEIEKNNQKENRINRIREENDALLRVIKQIRTNSSFNQDEALQVAKLKLENEKLIKKIKKRRQESISKSSISNKFENLQSPNRLIPKKRITSRVSHNKSLSSPISHENDIINFK